MIKQSNHFSHKSKHRKKMSDLHKQESDELEYTKETAPWHYSSTQVHCVIAILIFIILGLILIIVVIVVSPEPSSGRLFQ